jgi:hypothetical protein
MKALVGILGCTIIFISLTACSQSTVKDQIMATTTKAIDAIRIGDLEKFEALIENLGTLDREVIPHDVALYRKYIKEYYPHENPPIEITYLFNTNGQMLVKIHIFQDSTNAPIKQGDLRLLFGPTNVAPLSKITGYEVGGIDSFDSTHYHPLSYWQRAGQASQ